MHIFFIKIALFRKTQRGLKMNLRLILNCNFLIRVPVNFFKFIATWKQYLNQFRSNMRIAGFIVQSFCKRSAQKGQSK